MLKTCFDCIFGNSREESNNSVIYDTPQQNGRSVRAPPWPEAQNEEIMFLIPRELSNNDKITVAGTLRDVKKQFSFNLLSGDTSRDLSNVACCIEATFPHESNVEDKITIKIIKDGSEIYSKDVDNIQATGLYEGGSFTISIKMREGNTADIYLGSLYALELPMKHDPSKIRFLSLYGDVAKVQNLGFEFE